MPFWVYDEGTATYRAVTNVWVYDEGTASYRRVINGWVYDEGTASYRQFYVGVLPPTTITITDTTSGGVNSISLSWDSPQGYAGDIDYYKNGVYQTTVTFGTSTTTATHSFGSASGSTVRALIRFTDGSGGYSDKVSSDFVIFA